MRQLSVAILATCINTSVIAGEYIDYEGVSLTVFGLSHHRTENKKHSYHEVNPGLGLKKHLGSCFWNTANCYVGASYITKNSVGGNAYFLSAGSTWPLFTTFRGTRFNVGFSAQYVRYENPVKQEVYRGIAPIFSVGIGQGPWDLNVAILSKRPLQALTGKDAKAVYLLYLDYKF